MRGDRICYAHADSLVPYLACLQASPSIVPSATSPGVQRWLFPVRVPGHYFTAMLDMSRVHLARNRAVLWVFDSINDYKPRERKSRCEAIVHFGKAVARKCGLEGAITADWPTVVVRTTPQQVSVLKPRVCTNMHDTTWELDFWCLLTVNGHLIQCGTGPPPSAISMLILTISALGPSLRAGQRLGVRRLHDGRDPLPEPAMLGGVSVGRGGAQRHDGGREPGHTIHLVPQ